LLITHIRRHRILADMSQADLARLVGVRRETIGHLERGTYTPSLKLAWDIAKVFDTRIEELFDFQKEVD
jgi:cro/CI family transcriptional regulator